MEPPVAGGKRRRVQKACQFCHQRKMKCNNDVPKCSNCVTHGQVCDYAQGPKKPRPSNDRISRLEEENRQLHACLASGNTNDEQEAQGSARTTKSSMRIIPTETSVYSNPQSSHTEDVPISRENGSLGRGSEDAPTSNEFHGPSSVLFDENAMNMGQSQVANGGERPIEPPSSELMAEAAKQRQLESINFSKRQLDTDGVEQILAEELLSMFFKTANSAFLVVYRPAFMRDWACGGPHHSKLLLNAIYHNASRHVSEDSTNRSNTDRATLRARFKQRFKELLRENFDQSTTTTVQALLVMSVSLAALGNGRSVAWLYSGMAYRMIVDLGLHTSKSRSSTSKQASEEHSELQRRIFWSAFLIDKLQSFYQGRPASIQEADISVPFTLRDHHDELEQWAPMEPSQVISGSYSPTYCVSNFSILCRLSLIMNNVLNEIYREKKNFEDPDMLSRSLTRLNRDLVEWHSTVPLHLRFSPASIGLDGAPVPAPHTYTVIIMYYVLQILLHRPFVSEGHLQSALPAVALDSFSSCVAAADSIAQYLDSFNRAHTFKTPPYFLFYASYVSATIHVRIAAQKQLETNAYAYLRTCFLVFDMNREDNAAATNAKAVVQQLMDRMGVVLPAEGLLQSASANVQPNSTPRPKIATQETNRDDELRGDQILDAGLATSQLQGLDFNDLDFDAVLQSFDQTLKANESGSNLQRTTIAQQPDEIANGPLDMPGKTNMSDTIGDSFDQGFGNDVLFGFDFSDHGDSN